MKRDRAVLTNRIGDGTKVSYYRIDFYGIDTQAKTGAAGKISEYQFRYVTARGQVGMRYGIFQGRKRNEPVIKIPNYAGDTGYYPAKMYRHRGTC